MKLSPELAAKVLELAGEKPSKRKKSAPDVRTAKPAGWSVTLELPCRVVSEINRRDYWPVKARRAEIQRDALADACRRAGWGAVGVISTRWQPPLPARVTFTHVGRAMDDDNLRSAFKALRDEVANWLGVDDGGTEVAWEYQQRAGKAGCGITIQGMRVRPSSVSGVRP